MGLQHSTYRGYGFEIPAHTDFEHLDEVIADQPDAELFGRVQHLFLGDFERLFLLVEVQEIEPNQAARLPLEDYTRPERPGWHAALHNVAVRLGHGTHDEPVWLLLHDHS